ncbi:LytTR family DNA-binding domain-containing protein [Pedobacter sp. BMA]|uniref:LytR/AlgR family response regulator transcription factor n=1 Tax=Pedobacter sp. BMA TaxID=1663685 RepID=UPI00069DE6D5|nr:response regulator [Pedobacter sp. BMA]
MNKKQYSCIIIDDDPDFLESMSTYISLIPKLKLIGSYSNHNEVLRDSQGWDQIDFLFLDIRMEVSGIDLARMIRPCFKYLIFHTSYSEFALDAFHVGGDHYLVKPFSISRLIEAVNAVLKRNRESLLPAH